MILCIFPRVLREQPKRPNRSAGSTACTTVHIVATCSFVLLADVRIVNGCMSYSSVSQKAVQARERPRAGVQTSLLKELTTSMHAFFWWGGGKSYFGILCRPLWLILQAGLCFSSIHTQVFLLTLPVFFPAVSATLSVLGCCRCPRVSPSGSPVRTGASVSAVAAVGAGAGRCRRSERVAAGRRWRQP